jgi:prepilin-type N-terminal cleavage/methylation domain-containing protein
MKQENTMQNKRAFTRVELLVAVMVLAALAAIAVPRMLSGATNAKINACKANVDVLNSQIEQYYANKAAWPAALTDVTNDRNYFPEGAPVCPLGSAYSYNTTTHRVSDHIH